MITIKKITPPVVDLYDPNDIHLGTLNEYEITDVRLQIIEQNLTGYYVIFNNKKIKIDSNGIFEQYPEGLFDQLFHLTMEIVRKRSERLKYNGNNR